ncbi:MAG: PA14 domain-containing protein [Anaerolineae bacterium]|nr:PA14 domain-containing protein [Thermoflexales bacterium]MDW8406973.1 PA14 domain-containing protein [Anaerolineae bacterium]
MKSLTRKLLHVSISALALCASLFMMTPPARAASPEAGAARPASSDYVCVYHTVKRGDTLTRIANHYRVTIQAIQRANGLRGTRIYIGQRLCIPRPKPVPQPTPSPGPWYAEFWNNTEQSGVPAVVRTVAAINFDWGFGSPDPARVFADNFSTRFVRTATLQGGVYRFTFRVDDGLRVWIDNNVVYDQYGFVGQLNGQFDVEVLPGVHTIRVDYVERTGKASVTLTYARLGGPLPEPTPPSNNGPWYTEFFANMELKGPPVAVRTYGGLKFDWRGSSPVAGVPAAYWSARFSQFRYLGAGVYRFVVNSDDGVRVYVNDQLVIDRWGEQSARTWIGDIRLNAGTHSIRVEYLQVAGTSLIELYWQFLGG